METEPESGDEPVTPAGEPPLVAGVAAGACGVVLARAGAAGAAGGGLSLGVAAGGGLVVVGAGAELHAAVAVVIVVRDECV